MCQVNSNPIIAQIGIVDVVGKLSNGLTLWFPESELYPINIGVFL